MPGADPLPPLRVREQDGVPNVIPVFTIIVSNGTVVNQGGGTITLGMGTGAVGTPGASGGMAIGSGVTGGSTGAILFVDSSQNLGQNVANLFWNNGSTRVGIGTSSPAMALDVVGSGRTSSVFVLGVQATSAGHAVRAGRTLTTTYPVAGGGDLTADRTLTIDTAFLINSGRTLSTTFPLAGGGNLSADRTVTADTAFLVTSARTLTAGVGLTGGGNLGADRTVDLFTGGAGQYVITSAGATEGIAWINTAAAGGGPVYAPTGGSYVAFAADADLTNERTLVAGTYIAITTSTTQIFVSASDKTVYLPLALLTVQPDTGNAFWVARTATNVDMGHVAFLDSGEGIATYWGIVPFHVSGSPLWNLSLYSTVDAAVAANTALVSVRAKAVAHGEDLDSAAYTTVASAASYLIFRANTLTVSAVSGGNFDAVVAVSAGDYLLLEVNRHGGSASDALSDQWNVKAVTMRVNVF